MGTRPPREDRGGDAWSGPVGPLITLVLGELRGDLGRLVASRWGDPERRRAHELSSALEEACRRRGLEDMAVLAGAISGLVRLRRPEALPLLPQLREKFDEILRQAQQLAAERTKRGMG